MPPLQDSVKGNASALINHAVEVLGRSKQRLSVFRAIYTGKKKAKTVNEIAAATGLDRIRVLQEGRRLVDNEIANQIQVMGMTAYEKVRFYSDRRDKVIRSTQDPIERDRVISPIAPPPHLPAGTISIYVQESKISARNITIDDIESFEKIKRVKIRPEDYEKISEKEFKYGIAKILGEKGKFTDWGGEQNDLYTSKIKIDRKRIFAAFAFKGPGTRGALTPGKMGKNGDQIQRLFKSAARVFIVQYSGQIEQSVVEQMEVFAKMKSITEGDTICYGIIDGDDSNRLIKAYPKAFAPG